MPRPWTVALACAGSIALCAWDILTTLLSAELRSAPRFLAAIVLLSMLPAIFAVAAFRRKNWGRLVTIALCAIGALALPVMWFFDPSLHADSPISRIESVLYALIELVIATLLLSPSSNVWYRAVHADA